MLTGRRRQQQPGTDELELQPRRGGPGHLGEPGVDDVGRVRQLPRSERRGLLAQAVELVGRQPAEERADVAAGGADGRDDDEVTQPLQQVFDETPWVLPRLDRAVDLPEHRRAVCGGQRVDRRVEQLALGEPEQGRGPRVRQARLVGAGHELVEHRQGVAHRPASGADDEREHARLDRDLLGLTQLREVVLQPRGRHEPERVVVRARADRADDLLRLGRREHEFHVLRRLLDDLQQGVEALRGDHVRLVDDVDLVARLRRPVGGLFAQVTGVFDAAVAGRVDLDDVDRPGSPAGQRHARVALPARSRGGPLRAVQAARQDAGARRLAAAARTAEQVGVPDAARPQRLHERARDVLLPDDVFERLRPVAPIERRRAACCNPGCHASDDKRHPRQARRQPRAPPAPRP